MPKGSSPDFAYNKDGKMKENILIYRTAAKNFNEALPIGNGSMGAMVYGSLGTEKLTLNCDTLWSGTPHVYVRDGAHGAYLRACEAADAGRLDEAEKIIEEEFTGPFTCSYLPLGTLLFGLDREGGNGYSRALDMSRGLAYAENSDVRTEHLASFEYRCIASNIECAEKSNITLRFESQLKHTSELSENTIVIHGVCPLSVKEGEEPVYGENTVKFTAVIKLETDGDVALIPDGAVISRAKYLHTFLAVRTSFVNHRDVNGETHCAEALADAEKCIEAGYEKIKENHAEYYNKHYGAVKLNICGEKCNKDTYERLLSESKDNGLIELLFNFGRYLTVASSAKGSQATNLQGIWNEQLCAIWKSNYTVNINTEMNYWHTLMCGLSDFHNPVIELVKKISDTGRVTAKEFYGADGWVCHHNIDLWGNTAAVGGMGDEHIVGNSNFSYWSGASGWLCRNVFEYYEYTLDRDFLENTAYPLMKGAAEFYLSILRPVGDRMAISPATSPENHYVENGEFHSMGRWTTMSQSIAADLFGNCIKACDILGTDTAFREKLAEILPKLKPFEIGSDGRMLEWDREVTERDREHRHVSNLYGLYPADMITTDGTPELAEACRKSLETRGDDGTGWALAWKACLWAKLKDGDHALKLIRRQLEVIDSGHTSCELWGGGTYPNMLCAHPPFQIDGNFGITAAIAMLFLQCEDGRIKLLPALPRELENGAVSGLYAKGGIKVGIKWTSSRVTEAVLFSDRDISAAVEVNGETLEVKLNGGTEKVLKF